MTLVSVHYVNGKLHCDMTNGQLSVEAEASTLFGALAKTYLRLLIRIMKTMKRRKTWKER